MISNLFFITFDYLFFLFIYTIFKEVYTFSWNSDSTKWPSITKLYTSKHYLQIEHVLKGCMDALNSSNTSLKLEIAHSLKIIFLIVWNDSTLCKDNIFWWLYALLGAFTSPMVFRWRADECWFGSKLRMCDGRFAKCTCRVHSLHIKRRCSANEIDQWA